MSEQEPTAGRPYGEDELLAAGVGDALAATSGRRWPLIPTLDVARSRFPLTEGDVVQDVDGCRYRVGPVVEGAPGVHTATLELEP